LLSLQRGWTISKNILYTNDFLVDNLFALVEFNPMYFMKRISLRPVNGLNHPEFQKLPIS
jgi:hypothetical protein